MMAAKATLAQNPVRTIGKKPQSNFTGLYFWEVGGSYHCADHG